MAGGDSGFRYLGTGSPLAVEVNGPTVESCLARAVEGLGNALAVVHPSVPARAVRVAVEADTPAELLRALLDAAVGRMASHGEVALGLAGAARDGRRLHAILSVVPLSAARPPARPSPPTWQGVVLRRSPAGWEGVVLADF